MRHVLVTGAGFSGAVIARQLAMAGHRVTLAEARPHVGGNCHTARCPETGVMVHHYGPHIFHTDDRRVWDYVTRFGSFRPYRHRVFSTVAGRVYGLPVNLQTINQLYGLAMPPDTARAFIAARTRPPAHGGAPENFAEQALATLGPELYEAFFRGYTVKQWGRPPEDLPAAVLARLPLRFDYGDSYFTHHFQAIPEEGYTAVIAAMLAHPGITLQLSCPITPRAARQGPWDHVVWTGPLDGWFDQDLGALDYRTLDFERFIHDGDYQGCAVMNYGEESVPWTRITEHRHFAPWESHARSVVMREYSRACGPGDIPFYPIRQAREKALLARYTARAMAEPGVSFAGRLGTYRYLDMDVTIAQALDCAAGLIAAFAADRPAPVFAAEPV